MKTKTIKSPNFDDLFIHKQLKEIFDEVKDMKEPGITSDEPYIRPSSAPNCCIRIFTKLSTGLEKKEWERNNDFMMDYYTSIGTLTHLLFQKWFGRTGKLWGNWSCLCKGHKKAYKYRGRSKTEIEIPKVRVEHSTNNICPKCGKEMLYEEFEIHIEGYAGAVDGVIEFTVNNIKYHIVIDFKGSSAEKISKCNPGSKNPYVVLPDPKHEKQIGLYTYALKKYYGLNVIGNALLYTSRDTPIPKYKICAKYFEQEDWDYAEMLFNSQVKQIRILYKSLDLVEQKKDIDGAVAKLLKHKLCPDHKFYKKNVQGKYSECDYADECFSAPKAMAKMLKDLAKNIPYLGNDKPRSKKKD